MTIPDEYNLPEITEEDKQFLHDNPNTSDLVDFVKAYAITAIEHHRKPVAKRFSDEKPMQNGWYYISYSGLNFF